MEQHFVADNRRFLRLCSDMARVYGVLCLIVGGGAIASLVLSEVAGSAGAEHRQRWIAAFQPFTRAPVVVLRGLLALVAADFISYLTAGDGKLKWLLRHGHLVTYAYACFVLVMTIQIGLLTPVESESISHGTLKVGMGLFSLFSAAAVGLMWVGIGITLRKVVPIIHESKTLV
jgi:hypothetical protein